MNYLKFKYYFWKLKRQYKGFLKAESDYKSKSLEKKKFINFFIRDKEDEVLNKKVLDAFDKNIQKYKIKLYKKENSISKILFKLGIIDLNYIDILYKYKISQNNLQIIKDILKRKIMK